MWQVLFEKQRMHSLLTKSIEQSHTKINKYQKYKSINSCCGTEAEAKHVPVNPLKES